MGKTGGKKQKSRMADETYIRPREAAGKWKLAQSNRQAVYLYGVT